MRARPTLAVLVLILLVAPSASAQIVLPGTQPGDLVNWPLIQPSTCITCHGNYVAGRDYEPFDSWSGSMMANAARDPLFWAAVDIANQDVPGIGELCIRCHSPRAWLEGRSSTPDGSALTGFPDEPDNDFEGIDCHFCHRMYEGPEGTPFTENGQYWVDDGTPLNEPVRRGPFSQPFSPHPAAQSAYHDSSEFCGTCHDLRSPAQNLLDENGVDTGRPFPEQVTYTEWANSAFAAEGTSCQDCHMPPAEVIPAFACDSFNPARPAAAPDDAPVYRHDLSGANTFMIGVIEGEYGAVLGRGQEMAAAKTRAQLMLQSAASISVTPDPLAVEGDSLTVAVTVTNLTGHKLPTAYPEGRRMWIEFTASDALGTPFYTSGAYDDSTATLVVDPQLHLYQTEHGVHGGGPGFHLVLNNRIFSDTRIPPRGFVPDADTQPIGRTYPLQPDSTLAWWDDVSFRVPIPTGVQGPVQVRATLRYQTAARGYIEFLRDENTSGPDPHDRNYPAAPDRGDRLYSLWETYGKSTPVDMVSANTVVPVKTPPAAVNNLQTVAGHEVVHLGWDPLPVGVTEIRVLRQPWGDYPELGSTSSTGPAPVALPRYEDAVAAGWQAVYTGTATAFSDSLATGRDVFLYGAWHRDSSGIFSTGSFVQGRNYRIGDFGQVGFPTAFDGLIDGPNDLPVFSLAWGTAEGDVGFNPVVDIAPTDDGTRFGISTPDDVVDFEDLVIFSLQYGTAPQNPPGALRTGTAVVGLELERDGRELVVRADSNGDALHALSLELAGPALRILEARGGSALPGAHFAGVTRSDDSSAGSFACLGAAQTPSANGELLRLTLDGLPAEGLRAELLDPGRWTAIGPEGQTVELTLRTQLAVPTSTRRLSLSRPWPNPFNPRTEIQLSLPEDGPVEVAIFDLAGRRVDTLLKANLTAGTHPLRWDGLDRSDRAVASGTYLIRASFGGQSVTQRAVLVR